MRGFLVLTVAALAALAAADCPNACSGHGDCTTNFDYCHCYNGWMGNDCSQQLCPFGLSYIDTPNGDIDGDNQLLSGGFDTDHSPHGSVNPLNPMYRRSGYWEQHPSQLYGAGANGAAAGDPNATAPFPVQPNEGHFYQECSNRGLCDRSTGLCTCFTGFEGTACNRTVCPNDCSGHGVCKSVNDLTPSGLHYRLWDAEKTQVCDCDGGYFGPDCSNRKCMFNNDPLTVTTTNTETNAGLLERGEVQYVDVRCPYYGNMLGPAYITLTYTDAQFGDHYETPQFDILSASGSTIQALLKALPNQVLADYSDVNTVVQKVPSVSVTTIDTNNYYRIWITFANSLGNVPTLQGTPYFKCQGGAEVISDAENVIATYQGDGPNYDLTFTFSSLSATGGNVVVTNSSGNSLAVSSATTSVAWGPFDASTPSFIGPAATSEATASQAYGREATKVAFTFSGGNTLVRPTAGVGGGPETLIIKIHTQPTVTVKNVMYVLRSSGSAANVNATGGTATDQLSKNDTAFTTYTGTGPYGGAGDVDFIVSVYALGTSGLARVWLNHEVIGLITLPAAGSPSGSVISLLNGTAPAINLPTTSSSYAYLNSLNLTLNTAITTGSESFTFYFPKDPYAMADYYPAPQPSTYNAANVASGNNSLPSIGIPSNKYFSSGTVDDIWPSYTNFQAAEYPFTLILQVTRINTAVDTFRWKIAGDTTWSDTFYTPSSSDGTLTTSTTAATISGPLADATLSTVVTSGAGAPLGSSAIPSTTTPTPLYNILSFLRHYPDDPTHHDVQYVGLSWQSGPDNQLRLCNTQAATYYLQFGSDGLNDAPECSDRGVCDYTSGTCKCFKGYAGIDCTSQSNLAGGAGMGSSSAAAA